MPFKLEFNKAELTALANALKALDSVRFDAVILKNTTQMLNRAKKEPGGTPFKSGALREHAYARKDEMGYTMEYAPHVEYGHRTRDGGFVYGQHFLQRNVDTQRPIFREDLIQALRKAGK